MTGLDRLSTHRQCDLRVCLLIYYIINTLFVSVRVHMDGRVTSGSQSGGGHDENRKMAPQRSTTGIAISADLGGNEQRIEFRGRG